MKIDFPYLYRAYGLLRGKRVPAWHDVLGSVSVEIAETSGGTPIETRGEADYQLQNMGLVGCDRSPLTENGHIFYPVSYSCPGQILTTSLMTANVLRQQASEASRHIDRQRLNLKTGYGPFGILEVPGNGKIITDPDMLHSVSVDDRADREKIALSAAAATRIVDGVVYTSRYEIGYAKDSSGNVRQRPYDVIDRKLLIASLDLEQSVIAHDRPVDEEVYGPRFVDIPDDFASRLPDADLTAMLGLRRCLRAMFSPAKGSAVSGTGYAYDGSMSERFEAHAYHLRLAGSRLRSALLAGDSDVGNEARAAISAFIDEIEAAPPSDISWSPSVMRTRIQEMKFALDLYDAFHCDVRADSQLVLTDEDADAIEAASYAP